MTITDMKTNRWSLEKVISAIDSPTRRKILANFASNSLTVREVFDRLKSGNLDVKYRESVYRALEKLTDAGLVEKFYNKDKGICYRSILQKIEIDLENETIIVQARETDT